LGAIKNGQYREKLATLGTQDEEKQNTENMKISKIGNGIYLKLVIYYIWEVQDCHNTKVGWTVVPQNLVRHLICH
jgi:hypothetical protein